MDTTRRHLLRSTLWVAAGPRVGLPEAPPRATSLAPAAVASPADVCGRDAAFVNHDGWILRPQDRDALRGRSEAPDVLNRLPRVEAGEVGADLSGRR